MVIHSLVQVPCKAGAYKALFACVPLSGAQQVETTTKAQEDTAARCAGCIEGQDNHFCIFR